MGIHFRPLTRIEIAYRTAITELFERRMPALPKQVDPGEWIGRLSELSNQDLITNLGASLASKMVSWVSIENAKTWREASARSQHSQKLYRLLQKELQGGVGTRLSEITAANAQLIRSLPADVAQKLTGEIAKAQQMGARSETIAKMMQARFPELTKSRIHLIARTEPAKASSALTQARSEELGLQFYIWRTSEDQRVRRSHRNMDGVVVPWSAPPSPEALVGEKGSLGKYNAGNCPYCRCTQIVVLTLDDVFKSGSLARVFWDGRIQRMTRAQFARISGIPSRIAA